MHQNLVKAYLDLNFRRSFIIESAKNDIELFALHYFPDFFYCPFCPLHYWLFDKIQEKKQDKRLAVAAPRAFAKSTIMSFLFSLWDMAYEKKKFILIISETATQANSFLSDIITEIESNAELRQDFPGLGPAIDDKNQYVKWTDSDIVLKNGTKVIARGTGAKLRGLKKSSSRPDLIILDDCEDDDMVLTVARRMKIRTWFDKVVMNVGDARGCDIFICGTILHPDSLLKNIINRGGFDSKIFRSFDTIDGKDVPLWPEVWPIELLMKKKAEIGSIAFQSEFQNNPIEQENALFKLKHLQFFDIIPETKEIYFGVDLAVSKATKADYTVIAVVGVKDNNFFILDIWRDKVEFNDVIEAIQKMFELWNPLIIGIEDVAFQRWMIQELTRTTRLPIKPVPASKDKFVRATPLSVYYEQGRVHFKKNLTNLTFLIDEFLSFPPPSGGHDDIVDAVVHAVTVATRSRPKKKKLEVQNLDLNKLKGIQV